MIAEDFDRLGIVRSASELKSQVEFWKSQGLRVALVPTMGALHVGHLTLVETALAENERVIVSVFVNPAQFGPNEDFENYPRQEQEDIQKLEAVGAHLLYAPNVQEVYPTGFLSSIHVDKITDGLCGGFREGHFDGVCTVVYKLFAHAKPDTAYFGEKDYQQLCVIKRMVADLELPVSIKGVAIQRDVDGLALSSRNQYLTADEKSTAIGFNKTLFEMAEKLKADPTAVQTALEWGRENLQQIGFDAIDYLDVRDAESLETVNEVSRPARILSVMRLRETRLLDNVPVLI